MKEKEKENRYKDSEELKKFLKGKYLLDCGHHVTPNHNFGNNIMESMAKS